MKKLTSRQQQILDLIRTTIDREGMPPTRADICQYFNFRSPTAAEDHLKALERKGVITLLPGQARGIRLAINTTISGLPLIGQVAAGQPILAEQNIEDYFEIDPIGFKPRADYLLRVRGDSMKDIGILHQDLLAVHRTQEAHNGQIVVARLEDDVTVKRFRRHGNTITLQAENPDFSDIIIDLHEQPFTIEGLGVGVVRNEL